MKKNTIITVEEVFKSYVTGETGTLDVLKGVNLEISKGEVTAIVGSSGSGKSTLLHIMGALDTPTNGKVRVEEQDLFAMEDAALARYRNANIGFVFQFHHLLPEFSALENVAMPALIAGLSYAQATAKAQVLLEKVQVNHRANAKPTQLSGGEQQRVAVARALINNPKVVLADEPSGNLDEENAEMLHKLLWSLAADQEQTFVIVTHDSALASHADSVFSLREGALHLE
jgi:lipoprotein-releasing system ATP-binding protein